MAKKSRGTLTSEDRRLWKKVTETVIPRAGVVPLDNDEGFDELKAFLDGAKPSMPSGSGKKTAKKQNQGKSFPKSVGPKLKSALPPVTSLDRKSKSRLSRGITAIDGRIDLHGMTQDQARAALHNFIERAYASHWKVVLVITGKGRPVSDDENDWYEFGREPPGVLRRKTPEWLKGPNLRQFVVGFDTAAPTHGGQGALYVRLRGKRLQLF